MLIFKINILEALKDRGYTTYVLLNDKDMNKRLGSSQIQSIRKGIVPGAKTIDTLCRMLDKQPADLYEYIPFERYKALYDSGYFNDKGFPVPPPKES